MTPERPALNPDAAGRESRPPASDTLPRGKGTAIFAGAGAWQPRSEAVVFTEPTRVLTADSALEVHDLLNEVEREQAAGRYVAGYLSYEAGAAFGLAVRSPACAVAGPTTDSPLPLAWMAVYDPRDAAVIPAAEWKRLLDGVDVSKVVSALTGVTPQLNVTREEYFAAIARVREYIAAGDTYQVDYTVRARFDLNERAAPPGAGTKQSPRAPSGLGAAPEAGAAPAPAVPLDPLDYFLALVIRQPVPYAAYLDLGEAQIISLSPELFLRRQGTHLESRPMKGTRPRGASRADDLALAYQLAETEKERAENLMIVDMVRNDLGRVCRAGSVTVPVLYAVEPYRTVWQMVSTVTGETRPGASLRELMQAMFPGGSITGAPKHHTMELIAELETEPREVYTGTVGLFEPGGAFTASIAIRTVIHRQGRCTLGTGSGVVWDADAGSEYEETKVKAAFATPPASAKPPRGGPWRPDPHGALRDAALTDPGFYLFETLLLEAGDPLPAARPRPSDDAVALARYRGLREHLSRLSSSAAAAGIPFDADAALGMLASLAHERPEASVARLRLDTSGRLTVSTREAPALRTGPVELLVSPFRTDPDDPLLPHKTGLRDLYDREHRRAQNEGFFDALFLNRLDRVTEGAITNVFARFDREWLTPPVSDGLLPGTWRAEFLRQSRASEVSLGLSDLLQADEVLVGNSVRGPLGVAEIRVAPLMR